MDFRDSTILTCTHDRCGLVDYMAMSFLKWNARGHRCLPEVVVMNNGSSMHDPSAVPRMKFREVDNLGYRMLRGKYPERVFTVPSDRHCASIDTGLGLVRTRWCILVDDDVLFRPGSRSFFGAVSDEAVSGCAASTWGEGGDPRLLPFLCVIDVDRMRADGVRYYSEEDSFDANVRHDTGYHILREAYRLGWKTRLYGPPRGLDRFILHMGGVTFSGRDYGGVVSSHRVLWD